MFNWFKKKNEEPGPVSTVIFDIYDDGSIYTKMFWEKGAPPEYMAKLLHFIYRRNAFNSIGLVIKNFANMIGDEEVAQQIIDRFALEEAQHIYNRRLAKSKRRPLIHCDQVIKKINKEAQESN